MDSHEVLREAFQQSSPKEVAAALGVSLSLVYKWAEPRDGKGSGVDNPLDRVAELVRTTKSTLPLQWLCHQGGGFYIRNPNHPGDKPLELNPATNAILQQFADLLEAITLAAADQHVSGEETRRIRREWDELKAFTETFVRACEEGNFAKLKEPPPEVRGKS
jgi:hypothetical protein